MPKKSNITQEQALPDYEPLFNENSDTIRKKPIKLLVGIMSMNWARILLSILLYVVKSCAQWIIPIITANIINAVTYTDSATAKTLLMNAAILFAVVVQNIPTHVLYARYTDRMLRNIGAGLRNTLVRKLQHLSLSYHREIESGRIQSKFLRDIEAIEFFNNHFIKTVIPAIIGIIVSVAISVCKSGEVTIFYALVIPVNIIAVNLFRKKMNENNHRFRYENENMSANVSSMIDMIPVTKAHGLENEEISRLEGIIKSLKEKGIIVDRTNAYFGSITWVISQLLSGLCLIFTGYLAFKGKIDVGDIVIYQTYFNNISGNVQTLVNIYPELAKGLESVRSVSEIVLSDHTEDNRNKIKLRYVHGSIDFKNVYFRYPNSDKDIIKDFSLNVNPGECVAFVGSSGSGKSTIMNMIIGFLPPVSGELSIDGKPIEMLNLTNYRKFISVVPQNSILFKGTIKENITYGLTNVSEAELERAVKMANIDEFLPSLPDGINTVVGEHGDKLSGGQKQRISIARALIRNPRILILDEATSALDNISEYHVQRAISSLIKGRTTFIVAHRLSTIRDADKIVVMDEGRIVETGTFEELMEKKGRFYELKKLNEIGLEKETE
ncbi:MAG: ABC transporter ATP-binding protein [Clostridiales bacterium]|nr:ABC transporter ATP-binding protein [Clostridiales bacterium]